MLAKLILIIGQSNAITYSTASNGFVPYPGGWNPTMIGTAFSEAIWNSGWEQYNPGLTSYGNGTNVFWGPEANISLAKRSFVPQRSTYIFKYAIGGVGLAMDPATTWSPYAKNLTFDAFVQELTAACAQLIAYGIYPIIDECYWIGNESDCFDITKANSIMRDLPDLVTAIRAKFSAPRMKFIIARTKTTLGAVAGRLTYVSTIRAAQEACGALPGCAWADMDGLPSSDVSIGHYDPLAVPTMGDLLAAASAGIAPF